MKRRLFTIACMAFFTTTFSQTTDSISSQVKVNGVWQNNDLQIITRNADCAVTSDLQKNWDVSTQSWQNAFLTTYSNPSAEVSATLTQSWDALNNAWINNGRSFLVTSLPKREFEYQVWDIGSNKWISNYRIIEEDDNLGRTVVSEFDLYSGTEWQKIQRSLNTFDANNFLASSTFQMWMNNAWMNNGKTTYDYTGNGLTTQYYWANNVWVKFSRAFNDYIAGTAQATKTLGQILSGSVWENTYRGTNTFNDALLTLSSFQQNWDMNLNAWVNSSRASYDYYSDNNTDHAFFESWDTNTNSWAYGYRSASTDISCSVSMQLVPVSKTENNILLQQNKSIANAKKGELIEKRFNPFKSNAHTIVYDVMFNNNGKQSDGNAYELIISYGKESKSVSNNTVSNVVAATNKNGFILSPNPAKNYFNIDLSAYKNKGNITMKVSDVAGKMIMQQKMNPGMQRINLPSIQKGVYIVTIISGEGMQTQKLVVE